MARCLAYRQSSGLCRAARHRGSFPAARCPDRALGKVRSPAPTTARDGPCAGRAGLVQRALWRSAARTRLPRGGWLPASIALTASVGLALLAAPGATDPGEALVVLDAAPS